MPITQRAGSVEIATALADHTISRCLLWKVQPAGKAVFGRTSLDRDVTYDHQDGNGPLLYEHAGNASPTEVEVGLDLGVRSVDLQTFTDGVRLLPLTGITRTRALAGYFANTIVDIYFMDWRHPEWKGYQLFSGKMGKYELTKTLVTFELLDWAAVLARKFGRISSDRCNLVEVFGVSGFACRNNLPDGDDSGPRIEARTSTGLIATVVSPAHYVLSGITRPDGWATMGKLVLDAPDEDYDESVWGVKKWLADGNLYLQSPIPFSVPPGTAIFLREGCLGTWDACLTKDIVAGEEARPVEQPGNSFNFSGAPWSPSKSKFIEKKTEAIA